MLKSVDLNQARRFGPALDTNGLQGYQRTTLGVKEIILKEISVFGKKHWKHDKKHFVPVHLMFDIYSLASTKGSGHFRKSATIRESNHSSGVCREHYAY